MILPARSGESGRRVRARTPGDRVNDTPSEARTAASSRATWLVLGALALALFASVFVPAFLIRPFKPQTATAVAVAYRMRVLSPWITAVGLPLVLWLAFRLVRSRLRRWQCAPLVVCVGLAGLAAWFARQNHFEWMFHPLPSPAYA